VRQLAWVVSGSAFSRLAEQRTAARFEGRIAIRFFDSREAVAIGWNRQSLRRVQGQRDRLCTKPFSAETITAALLKVQRLQNFFQRPGLAFSELSRLMERLHPNEFKKSFLVFSQQKYQTIATEEVAYFYVRNETTMLVNMSGLEYPLTQTLEEVQHMVDGKDFFRLNRQYLIAFRSIKEVEHFFARKLSINLKVPAPEKLLVGKDKTSRFLAWLDQR